MKVKKIKVKKTLLTGSQINRIYNYCNDNGKFKAATLCEVEGTAVRKIEIEYYNMGKEILYPDDSTLDYILNGVHVERNKA